MVKNNFCTFYVVRHGETEWNVNEKIQGHHDSPLTKKGILQIKNTASQLSKVKFDAAYSSDLLRAKRTGEIIALEHKLAVQTTKLLRERNFGHLEGKTAEELKKTYELYEKISDEERFKHKISEDIESDEEIVSRFITFIREVSILHPGETILITTHGGMIRALLVHLGWSGYKNFFVKNIGHAAHIKLLSDGVDFFIKETKGIKRGA